MNFKIPTLLIFSLFYSFTSHAIRGELLPDSELPHNVCKITIGTLRHILQGSYPNGEPIPGVKPVVIDVQNQFVCSANLIATDTILTAAHCFQGNNEWKVPKGWFQYPKLDAQGNRLKGCQDENYQQKPECVDHHQFGTLTERWINTRVECPREDGSGFESRPLKLEMGYSHPLYTGNAPESRQNTSNSIANFDISFYKLETPITNIKPMEVAWDAEDMLNTLKTREYEDPSSRSFIDQCRSFGYGDYDFHEGTAPPSVKYGVLHGANTPVARFHSSFLESLIDARDSSAGLGWVDHGDSGGAILCRGKSDHHYRLFGVISRGITRSEIQKSFEDSDQTVSSEMSMEDADDLMHVIARSDYSLPSFNKFFIDYTLKNGKFPRPLDTHYWYDLFGPFVDQQILHEIDQTKSCIQTHKREMSRSTYHDYRNQVSDVEKTLQKAVDLSNQYEGDQGLFLSKVSEFKIIEANRHIEWCCRNGVEY